jgi:tryptophan synthase alpha chain
VVLVAPTTTSARIATLARAARAFVYCVSRTGVTGSGGPYASNLSAQVSEVRRHSPLPVVVGFGIRSPEDARRAGAAVDGVVIGARLIEILEAGGDAPRELGRFVAGVRRALDQA